MEELQMIYYIQMNSVCTGATTVVITVVVPVNKIFIPAVETISNDQMLKVAGLKFRYNIE